MLCPEGVLSDSEEDKGPEAVAQQNTTSAWSNKRKQSAEQGGYSSEASSGRGESTLSYTTQTLHIIKHKGYKTHKTHAR